MTSDRNAAETERVAAATDRRRGTSRIDNPLPASPARSAECGARSEDNGGGIPPAPVSSPCSALPTPHSALEKDRLIGRIELLREAWRHARGAIDLFADTKVSKALDLLAEATSRAEQQLVSLSGLVSGPPPDEGLVAADVSGYLKLGQTLRCGPLEISPLSPILVSPITEAKMIKVVLGSRAEVEVHADDKNRFFFRATTDGRDYPEVVAFDPKQPTPFGSQSAISNLQSAIPLVSIGQGDSQVDIREEDVGK
jgi:hypothetical protein